MLRVTEKDLSKFQDNSGRVAVPLVIPKLTKKQQARMRRDGLDPHNARHLKEYAAVLATPEVKTSKYGNTKVTHDDIVFDSRLEGRRYQQLKLLRASKHVIAFWRQPVFDLPGGVIYRGDFLIHWALDDPKERLTCEDCKGADTRESINKRKQVKALYGIAVILVRGPT